MLNSAIYVASHSKRRVNTTYSYFQSAPFVVKSLSVTSLSMKLIHLNKIDSNVGAFVLGDHRISSENFHILTTNIFLEQIHAFNSSDPIVML